MNERVGLRASRPGHILAHRVYESAESQQCQD